MRPSSQVDLLSDPGIKLLHINNSPLKTDPTRTSGIRRRFIRDFRKRMAELKALITETIVTEDVFALKDRPPLLNQLGARAFEFDTDAGKIQKWQAWFKDQVDSKLMATDAKGRPWTATYVEDAYRKGMVRAYTDTAGTGLDPIPGIEGLNRRGFLNAAFNAPETVSKLELLATRNFTALRGISDAMSQQMGFELAQGISRGDGPREIAKNLRDRVDGLTKRRADTIARTETIHAHSEGQLDSFERLDVEEVGVMAEWSTAGDDRVCPLCFPLEGNVMTIAEARGLIPRHPNCRCTWIPAVDPPGTSKGQKKRLQESVKKSIKAGGAQKDSLKKAAGKSRWKGKGLLAKRPRKPRRPAPNPLSPQAVPRDKYGSALGSNAAKMNELAEKGLFTNTEIAKSLNVGQAAVSAHLNKLRKRGIFTKDEKGRWKLPDGEGSPKPLPPGPGPKPLPPRPKPKGGKKDKLKRDEWGSVIGTNASRINALAAQGQYTNTEIAKILGIDQAQVSAHLNKLKRKGLFEKDDQKHWIPTGFAPKPQPPKPKPLPVEPKDTGGGLRYTTASEYREALLKEVDKVEKASSLTEDDLFRLKVNVEKARLEFEAIRQKMRDLTDKARERGTQLSLKESKEYRALSDQARDKRDVWYAADDKLVEAQHTETFGKQRAFDFLAEKKNLKSRLPKKMDKKNERFRREIERVLAMMPDNRSIQPPKLSASLKIIHGAPKGDAFKDFMDYKIRYRKGGGGHMEFDTHVMEVPGLKYWNEQTAREVFVHEWGHWLSRADVLVMRNQNRFWTHRTKHDKVEIIGEFYVSKTSKKPKPLPGRKDKFKEVDGDGYAGRLYPGAEHGYQQMGFEVAEHASGVKEFAPEMISVGLEEFYKDPVGFARKDPEWFDMVIASVKGLEWGPPG